MRVIRYGPRRIDCPKCKSLLEFEDRDIIAVKTIGDGYRREIACPVCYKRIVIETSEREAVERYEVSDE